MRTSQGVLLLAVALVALSSEIISTGMAAREAGLFPPEKVCSKIIGSGACDPAKCDNECVSRLNGVSSKCVAAGCLCLYNCYPPNN